MRKLIFFYLSVVVVLLSAFTKVISSTGMQGRTSSPGESTCDGCHSSFALNSGAGSISISSVPSFINNKYVAQQTYTITVHVNDPFAVCFGFDTEILDSAGANAGDINIISGNGTQVKYCNIGSNLRKDITHSTRSFGTGNTSFSYTWQAPIKDSSIIYVASVAANNDSTALNDHVYTTRLGLTSDNGFGINKITEAKQLFKIFPNPANKEINVLYYLEESCVANLELFSIERTEITLLLGKEQAKGNHQLKYKLPENIKSGIYYIRLTTDKNNTDFCYPVIIN